MLLLLNVDTGAVSVLRRQPLPVTTKLSVVTSRLVSSLRQKSHLPLPLARQVLEHTNDALLKGIPLRALVCPTFPVAIVM